MCILTKTIYINNTSSIYIVDNDPIYQLVVKKILERILPSSKIFCLMDGSEAWESLQSNTSLNPNVILLDLDMPLMDGWEFMELFEAWNNPEKANIKIFIVSSSIVKEDIEKSKKFTSIADYITKPISLTSLEKILLG